ncbi:MAG: SseB family protein [Rhodobacteraceae bacterium]|nr:SseB family protein [Paracoccaceae bacterium]MCC6009170.1 SseB family protein [Paracoccaceae bacterium]
MSDPTDPAAGGATADPAAETALDHAWRAVLARPGDDAARLGFYARLSEAELFLLLERDPEGERIDPRVFPLEDGPMVVAFDTESRLADFTGMAAPYVAVPGRALVRLLADAEPPLALGLNLGDAPSARHLPPEVLAWLADALSRRPAEVQAAITAIDAPRGLPESLLPALDARLARAGGLAALAWLVAVRYAGGGGGHMLAFIDPAPGAEPTLARALGEALTFSGVEAGVLDIAFFAASDPVAARLARVGLRFDLPVPANAPARPAVPPGMDPDRPPRLR